MGKLDFLSGDAPTETEVVDQTEVVEQPDGPARGPDGKFIAAEPSDDAPIEAPAEDIVTEPVPAVEPPAVAAPAPAEPGHVPISALLDEREKRQAEARKAEALEKALADLRAKQNPPAPIVLPRPDEDPEAYARAVQSEIDNRAYLLTFQQSKRWAAKEHGAEQVDEALKWGATKCDEDPHFNASLYKSEDPVETVVQAWKRDQLLSKVQPSDWDEYQAWKATRDAALTQPPSSAAPAASPTPAPKAPTRSLATAPSAGGPNIVPTGAGQSYDAAFSR